MRGKGAEMENGEEKSRSGEKERTWNRGGSSKVKGLKDLRQWLQSRGLKKWFKRDNLIILVLAGVLLFIIALPERKEDVPEDTRLLGLNDLENETAGDCGEDTFLLSGAEDQYAEVLEKRLAEVLSQVEGVGQVQVMITLKSSGELVLDRETPVMRSSTSETDSQGGSRTISQVEMGDSVVYRSQGSESAPYVIKTLSPEIEGVLVVAQGAGDAAIKRTVTAVVQALFGVEAHRVSVVKMESE